MTVAVKTQAHLTLAYERWRSPGNIWSQEDFWDQLSAQERVAVYSSNLIAQVHNGGFTQWHDNDYATPDTLGFLLRFCARLDTKATNIVFGLLLQFKRAQAKIYVDSDTWDCDGNYDAFDSLCQTLNPAFWAISKEFLTDVEASL